MKKAFFIALLFAACSNEVAKTEKPKPFIDEEKMAEVLIDLHLAEATLSPMMPNAYDSAALFTIKNMKGVLEKHQIVDSVFRKNFDYYITQPEKLAEIYDQVIQELSKQQAEALIKENEPD